VGEQLSFDDLEPPSFEDEPPRPPPINLSPDQAAAMERLLAWDKRLTPLLKLGGLAGVGKTTLMGQFARQVKGPLAFVTFTGRASSVLSRTLKAAGVEVTTELKTRETAPRGHFCSTIHRLIYKPVLNEHEEVIGYAKRTRPDRPYRFIVIDEASMVGDRIFADIKALGVPILAVGDHGQLEPVRDRGSLMAQPDIRLEKIHRQAEGNPIIQFAHHVRNTGRIDGAFTRTAGKTSGVYLLKRGAFHGAVKDIGAGTSVSYMGVLCYKNKTRVSLNGVVRKALGYEGIPRKGETMVCLKNVTELGIFNGMRGWLTKDIVFGEKPWHLLADIEFPEDEIPERRYTLNGAQINREETFKSVEQLWDRGLDVKTMGEAGHLFDFGWAMSVHKFQGSQLHTALIYLDRQVAPRSEEWRRWIYTAATRASDRVLIFQ
jgi:exodeoxyribonuclease-5